MSMASQSIRPSSRGPLIDADLDLAALGAALWRKRYKILQPTILVALVTFAVVTVIPPKYQSEARVLIVGRDNVFLRPDADKDIIDRGIVDPEAVTSQAQLVLSREVANQVIDELKLGALPEFDPALKGVSLVRSLLGLFGIVKNPLSMTPEERVLEAYYERLSVYPVEKSRVIVIDFQSENPELAARVANAIADAYLQRQQLAKQEQARSAGLWLSGEIEQMRKRVADAEAKVEAFRAKSNLLVGPNGATLSAQQLGDLNAQLAAARAQKADAEAKAKIIRQMLKSREEIDSSDILNSELIRRLSEQRVTLRAQLAEQSSSLLDNHPRIKELKAQIEGLDKQIRHEAETIARSLENDSKLADARVEAQLATFDQFKSLAATSNEQDVQLRALERDAKSQRDLLESYLAKYREASARDTIAAAPPDARVISRAVVSNVPAFPKKLPTVLISTLAALVLFSGIALTRELLAGLAGAAEAAAKAEVRPVARAAAETETKTEVKPETTIETKVEAKAEAKPEPIAEPTPSAARTTAASIGRSWRGFFRRPRPGAVTGATAARRTEEPAARAASWTGREASPASPQPIGVPVGAIEEFAYHLHREGLPGSQTAFFTATPQLDTSWIAIKFARALAKEARAVLVGLGADNAAIKEISGEPNAAGLAELAAGKSSFSEIITKDKVSDLNLIVSGRKGVDSRALIAAPGIGGKFEALARTYAHVVIDAGALGGADLIALAGIAPHAILVVDTLTNPVTVKAHDLLLDAGFDNVTIVVAGRPEPTVAAAPEASPPTAPAAAA